MKKIFLFSILALLPGSAFCAGDDGAESRARAPKFEAESREFISANKAYHVKVDYSASGGGGRARLEFRSASGKKLSVFETRRAPFSVTISGDGRRLFALNGFWSQSVTITDMVIYNSAGKVLATHDVRMVGPSGEDFSGDYSVYALGADPGQGGALYVFNSESGSLLWKKKFKERVSGLKLSGDGARLVAVFSAGKDSYKVSVFEKDGSEAWRGLIKTKNNLIPRVVSSGGEEFELWEGKMVYDEKVDYYRDTILKKRRFRFTSSGAEQVDVKEVNERANP